MKTETKAITAFTILLTLLLLSIIPISLAAVTTVGTDKPSYFVGENVIITGTADPTSLVGIQVTNPVGTVILLVSVTADSAGTFTRTFRLPTDAVTGTYTVSADGKVATFQVTRDTTAPIIGTIVFDKPSYLLADTVTITVTITDDAGVASATSDVATLTRISGDEKSGVWSGSFKAPSVRGTYTLTVTAKDFSGNTAVKSASYKVVAPGAELPIAISLQTGEVYAPGDTARIYAAFTFGGVPTDPVVTAKMIHKPDGARDSLPDLTKIQSGWYYVDYKVPNILGTYGVYIAAKANETENTAQTIFQVKEAAATAAQISKLSDDVKAAQAAITSAITSAQTAITGAITSAQAAITGKVSDAQTAITSAVTSAQTTITGAISTSQTTIMGAVSGVGDSVRAAQTALSGSISAVASTLSEVKTSLDAISAGVAQASTFVLVVTVLAVIVIVLEVVVLIRRR